MKVVVTGGSGQLGTVMLRRLLRDRTIKQVINIDRAPPALPGHKLVSINADVRDSDIGRHFAGADALIHLAFIVTGHRPRAEVDSVNIGGSQNVFRAAAAAGIGQIIYTSSIAAYGVVPGHALPLYEDSPRVFQEDFAYAATKFQVEAFLDEFEREHPNLIVTRLRPSILFGQAMDHQLGQALRRRTLFSISTTPMPIVWDEDVADAAMLALKKRARGAFNLSADALLSPAELAREGGLRHIHLGPRFLNLLLELGPHLRRLNIGRPQDPAWLRNVGVSMVASSARAKEVLGWSPRYPTAAEVIRHFVEVVPKRLDRRLSTLFRLIELGARRMPKEAALVGISERLHLQISGPGGGDIGITVEDCRLHITKQPARPPTAVLQIKDTLLLDLLTGRSDVASAQLTGKIRIDGEPRAIMILGGIIARFQLAGTLPGAAGFFGRAMQKWLGRGSNKENASR